MATLSSIKIPDPSTSSVIPAVTIPDPSSSIPTSVAIGITSKATEVRDEDAEPVDYVPGTRLPTEYLDMKFESCFYEHKSNKAKGFNLYGCLGDMFQCTKLCMYTCCVFYFGIILTFIWGLLYGVIAFAITYVWSPLVHIFIICLNMGTPFISTPLRACLGPLCACCSRRRK